MVLGLSGYLYSFGNLILTPEPKKPIELNKPGIEELVEKERYQEIKRDYTQQEDQFAEKMLYSTIFGIFSTITLGIGLKGDKRNNRLSKKTF